MPRGLPRVLVLTGTSGRPFPRLLDALPALLRDGVAGEVRVQSAHAPPRAEGLVALGTLAREALAREIAEADVVVTHAGSGSCFDAMRAGHRPVVVARRRDLGEVADDHQTDLASELVRSGRAVDGAAGLAEAIPRAVRERRPAAGAAPAAPASLGPRLREAVGPRGRRPRAVAAPHVRRADAAEYAAFYRACPRAHPLQSVAWGEARRLDGWEPEWWLAGPRGGTPLSGAQVLRRGRAFPAYLAYGPVASDVPDAVAAARALLLCVGRRGALGLLWGPYATPPLPRLADTVRCVAVEPPSRTGFVTLDSDEDLLARLRAKWRWALKRAMADPETAVAWPDPATAVPDVLARAAALAERKGFAPPIRPEVGAAFARGAADAGVRLLAVTVGGGPARTAAWVAAVVGDTAQTLWTVHDEGAAEGAGRLALWHLLRACREAGCRRYDLAGIDDEGNPGVASFKRGVRPETAVVPGLRWLPPAALPPPLARVAVEAAKSARGRGRHG
jgi:UDP-N-acetylglucosamine transferase subunit ALG13